MSILTVIALLLIFAGAVVMAVSLRKFGVAVNRLKQVSPVAFGEIRGLITVHITLMSFFLVGYLTVALFIGLDIQIAGALSVGIIFFLGAVFVRLGIRVQNKMTASIKDRYDQAIHANRDLERERKNLTRINDRLSAEIAERIQAEKALTGSKAFLQAIIDSLPEQLVVINRDHTLALANRKALESNRTNRLSDPIHCYQLFYGIDKPCSGDEHICPLAEIVQTGKPVTVEHTHMDPAGRPLVVEIMATPIIDEAGEINQIVESTRDITARRQAEEQLRESEERYRMLSEVTLEGICLNDKSVIIDVNESFARMFGYDREDLIGIDAAEKLIAPESRDHLVRIVSEGSQSVYEAIGVRSDGTLFSVEIEGRNVHYKGRTVRVASVRDITERKRVEQRMALLQKMQAIGTLASGIAHDFNNILSAIMGYTEMCLWEADRKGKMASRLGNILQASHRAKELVGQILSFSRSEPQKARPIKINPLIEEALKLLRPSIPTNIDIVTDIDTDVGYINADATQIHQILMNLCTNAAHAMHDGGGTLTISLKKVDINEEFQNSMAEVKPGAYVNLRVADTGHGIEAQHRHRIFEPYFTTKEKVSGTGLGLYVVHGIVQQYNGRIDVTGKPGQGTAFSIFFPEIEMQSNADAQAARVYPTGKEQIMLVDDDTQLVEMNSEMLASFGYRVIPAAGPADALKTFKKSPESFDLVITDQTMPGMSGEMLISRLREIRPDLPSIICTGYSVAMDKEKARRKGIEGFLLKPVRMAELARTVRHVLDKRAMK